MKSYFKLNKSETQTENYKPSTRLLGAENDIEITQYEIGYKSTFFIRPPLQLGTYNMYYIVKGSVEHEGDIYSATDFVTALNNTEPHKFTALEDTILLNLSSKPGDYEISNNVNVALFKMLKTIQEKDHYTSEHCKRVMRLSSRIAEEMHTTKDELRDLTFAAAYHDAGKINVPDAILNKADTFTKEEYETMKEHAAFGYEIVKAELSESIADIIVMHHERLDGSGYPHGITEMPKMARILATCDTYDAMTTTRVYKAAKTHEEAIAELRELHTQYDQEVVDMLEKFAKIALGQ